MWIKRGDFVFVSPIEEGDKVKGQEQSDKNRSYKHLQISAFKLKGT